MRNLPCALCFLLALAAGLIAAEPPAKPETTKPALPISDRQQSLLLQLSDAEANIQALNLALKRLGYQVGLAYGRIDSSLKGNELMDRKGGGPVGWQEFYGKTARSFYLPDSEAALHAQGNGRHIDIQIAEGHRPIQTPKQFEAIYKANNDQAASALKKAAALEQTEVVLLARRQKHEADQSRLWAMLALERVKDREIADKPLYRFKLKSDSAPADSKPELLRPFALFLRTADKIAADTLESVDTDQQRAYADLSARMKDAYTVLRASLADALLAADLKDADKTRADSVKNICKQLFDECSIIAESNQNSLDREKSHEDASKLVFRAQLQDSLARFAATFDELDAGLEAAAAAWNVTPEKGVASLDQVPAHTTTGRAKPAVTQTVEPAPARAAILIKTSKDVRVEKLAPGSPRLYDSKPLRKIGEVSSTLDGFQFTSIPQRIDTSYQITVNKPATIYVFGFRANTHISRNDIFGDQASKWEDADQAIKGINITRVFRRQAAAGEVIDIKWFEASIAAPSIELDQKP